MDKEFAVAAENYVDKEQQPNNVLNLEFYYLFSKNGKKDIGEAPRILDSNLVEFSRIQIEKFIQSKGYLKAKVQDTILIKKKKAELVFTTFEGPMYRIRKISDSIPDKKVQALYRENRPRFSHLQPGGRFDADSLAYDRDGFFQIMKRNGYFDFYRQYLNFNADTTFNNGVVDIVTTIDNPDGKDAHPIYTINNTLITIANTNGTKTGKADTIQVDSQYRFVDYSHRFKPHVVTDYIFQKKGDIYNADMQAVTTARLSELDVFRNVPNPQFTKTADSANRLNSKIDIIPLKRMSDRVEGEFLFSAGKYGYDIGNTFTDRNLFHDAAILQLKVNESILYDTYRNIDNTNIENQDFKVGLSLIFPRIISPFHFAKPGRYGVPHTTISTNYSLFFQEGLVKRNSFITSLTYDFAETANKLHSVTPINIEFSRGVINKTADSLLLSQNRYSYVYLIGRTILTTGSQYTYQYNGNKLNTYSNFIYFRGALDVGGNLMSGVANALNTPRDTLHQRTFLGYTFSQYAKEETDFRVYTNLGGESQFVFRLNSGIGIPYGNSNQLIFEKNFYAGGANDMRAWLPRTLGPGNFNRATAYGPPGTSLHPSVGDTLRTRLQYLDQFGEIKIVTNLEYRYKLVNNFFGSVLRGALFMDAGNVWRLHNETESPGGQFSFGNLWNSTAIGIGTGFRFDVGFFVFRLDAALKFKDPQFAGADQWVLINHFNELFRTGAFKNTYFTNNGDSYNFLQLNFGIGLPF
jgi:hypothetical protein